eukprot:488722-Rhodomonas_salina.2
MVNDPITCRGPEFAGCPAPLPPQRHVSTEFLDRVVNSAPTAWDRDLVAFRGRVPVTCSPGAKLGALTH